MYNLIMENYKKNYFIRRWHCACLFSDQARIVRGPLAGCSMPNSQWETLLLIMLLQERLEGNGLVHSDFFQVDSSRNIVYTIYSARDGRHSKIKWLIFNCLPQFSYKCSPNFGHYIQCGSKIRVPFSKQY